MEKAEISEEIRETRLSVYGTFVLFSFK